MGIKSNFFLNAFHNVIANYKSTKLVVSKSLVTHKPHAERSQTQITRCSTSSIHFNLLQKEPTGSSSSNQPHLGRLGKQLFSPFSFPKVDFYLLQCLLISYPNCCRQMFNKRDSRTCPVQGQRSSHQMCSSRLHRGATSYLRPICSLRRSTRFEVS